MSTSRPENQVGAAPRSDNEPLYADAFENAPHAIALIAPDGSILEANRSLCGMLGFSRDELLDLNVSDITHPDDLGTEAEQRRRLASADIGRYELVHRYVRKDRVAIWVRLSVSATRRGCVTTGLSEKRSRPKEAAGQNCAGPARLSSLTVEFLQCTPAFTPRPLPH